MNRDGRKTFSAFRPPIRLKVSAVMWYLEDHFPGRVVLIEERPAEHSVFFTMVHLRGGARHDVEVNYAFINEFENCVEELAERHIIELIAEHASHRAHITVGKQGIEIANT